jgi:hypothetical protein
MLEAKKYPPKVIKFAPPVIENAGRSRKFALYIFGAEVARDLRCATPLSSSLFEKWRAEP